MSRSQMRAKHHADKIANKLVGGEIVKAIISDPDDDLVFFGFQVRKPSGETFNVWIQSDAEGNDTGYIDIS